MTFASCLLGAAAASDQCRGTSDCRTTPAAVADEGHHQEDHRGDQRKVNQPRGELEEQAHHPEAKEQHCEEEEHRPENPPVQDRTRWGQSPPEATLIRRRAPPPPPRCRAGSPRPPPAPGPAPPSESPPRPSLPAVCPRNGGAAPRPPGGRRARRNQWRS